MTSCKACGAPLDGPMSFIAGLMGVKPSAVAPGYCNKCEEMILARKRVGTLKVKGKPTAKKKKTKKTTSKRRTSRRRR